MDQSTSTCGCSDGWTGAKCSTCSSSAACAALTGDQSVTCVTGFDYKADTKYKGYTCVLRDSPLAVFVQATAILCDR